MLLRHSGQEVGPMKVQEELSVSNSRLVHYAAHKQISAVPIKRASPNSQAVTLTASIGGTWIAAYFGV